MSLLSHYPPKPTPAGPIGGDFYTHALESGDYLVEPKLDGVRALRIPGLNRLVSRTGKYLPGTERWGDLPRGPVLDGELVTLPDGERWFYVFDAPPSIRSHGKPGLQLEARRRRAITWLRDVWSSRWNTSVMPVLTAMNQWREARRVIDSPRLLEGVVFKRRGSTYDWQHRIGGTTSSWFKCKPGGSR